MVNFEKGILNNEMQTAIDHELRFCIDSFMKDSPQKFKSMMEYQLGWLGDAQNNLITGKRIRPLLVLTVCNSLGGDWRKALPVSASVELIHNFSLIHDDIQDHSLTRRGRDTVWVKWGEPQAINAGDAMLTMANLESLRLSQTFSNEVTLRAVEVLQNTCFQLTGGQYLDLEYESAESIEFSHYWKMVNGKTGALISACFRLGALLAGQPDEVTERCSELGSRIGTAFQVQDDWLGIWGNQDVVGKSTTGDLLERKKTYPILNAIKTVSEFHDYWISHPVFSSEDVGYLLNILNRSGLRENCQVEFNQRYKDVLEEFDQLFDSRKETTQLRELIQGLFARSA